MKPTISLLFIMAFTCLEPSFGQKFYLSPEGNDSNPGSPDKPLATLTAARDRVRDYRKSNNVSQPVEIIPLAGEYFMFQPLQLTADDSGTPDSPLKIRAMDGTRVVFRGGVQLTGIEKVTEELWKIFVPQVAWYNSYFDQLYVNGRRAVRARTPNKGFYTVKNASESILVKGNGLLPQLAVQEFQLNADGAACLRSFSRKIIMMLLLHFITNGTIP